jgi:hypothetical protein
VSAGATTIIGVDAVFGEISNSSRAGCAAGNSDDPAILGKGSAGTRIGEPEKLGEVGELRGNLKPLDW